VGAHARVKQADTGGGVPAAVMRAELAGRDHRRQPVAGLEEAAQGRGGLAQLARPGQRLDRGAVAVAPEQRLARGGGVRDAVAHEGPGAALDLVVVDVERRCLERGEEGSDRLGGLGWIALQGRLERLHALDADRVEGGQRGAAELVGLVQAGGVTAGEVAELALREVGVAVAGGRHTHRTTPTAARLPARCG
jgi:hypothetical protein